MTKNFRDWLTEGEAIYNTTLDEFRSIESQLESLESQLAAKKLELNQIATVIGKPNVEGVRHAKAEIVDVIDTPHMSASAVPVGNMARALTGRGAPIGR